MKTIKKFFLLIIANIYIVNLSSQSDLQYLGSTTGAACFSIKYYNGYVFTGTGATLRANNVSNSTNIPYNYVFEYRFSSQIIRMEIKDHYLFVCANYDGIYFFNLKKDNITVCSKKIVITR